VVVFDDDEGPRKKQEDDASDYDDIAMKRGQKSSQKAAPAKARARKESQISRAARKRKQAGKLDAKTAEPPIKLALRPSSA
jgi:hypothetical protein